MTDVDAMLGFFSPQTFKLVMQSVNPVIIAGLATVLANVLFFFRRLSRATKAGMLVALTIAGYLGGAALVRDVETLRETNDTKSVDITDLAVWQQFASTLRGEGADVFERADATKSLDLTAHTTRVTLDEVVDDGRSTIVDVLCLNAPVRGSDRRCKISWELYSNFHSRAAVDRIMGTYGYDTETPLVFYCQEGFTSSRLAFILGAYGYDVRYAALSDVKDPSILDASFAPTTESDVIITPLRFDVSARYTYFLFEFDDQNALAYNEFFMPQTTAAETYRNIRVVQVFPDYDTRLLREAGLSRLVTSAAGKDVRALAGSRVICRNKLHCYLTRIYLASHEVTTVKQLSCVRCTEP